MTRLRADRDDIAGDEPLQTLHDLELDLLPVRQRLEAVALDEAVVQETVFAPILKPNPLLSLNHLTIPLIRMTYILRASGAWARVTQHPTDSADWSLGGGLPTRAVHRGLVNKRNGAPDRCRAPRRRSIVISLYGLVPPFEPGAGAGYRVNDDGPSWPGCAARRRRRRRRSAVGQLARAAVCLGPRPRRAHEGDFAVAGEGAKRIGYDIVAGRCASLRRVTSEYGHGTWRLRGSPFCDRALDAAM